MKYIGETAPAWSIPGKTQTKPFKPEEKLSDPVIVDTDAKSRPLIYENPPSFAFPKASRMRPSSSAPNLKPIQARPSSDYHLERKTSKKTFPTAERFQVLGAKLYQTPGPADYRPDGNKMIPARMPNFSFAYKHDSNTGVDVNPTGPSTYKINYSQRETTKPISFPKDEKILLQEIIGTAYTPGPGSYQIPEPRPNTASRKGTFGFGKRTPSTPSQQSTTASSTQISLPNPDIHTIAYKAEKVREQYESKNSIRPQTSAARKLHTDGQLATGGTENIGFNGNKPNAPAFKFGSSGRRPLTGATGSGDLGPGAYFGAKSLTSLRPLTANATFTKDKRRPLGGNPDVPGPGAYETIRNPDPIIVATDEVDQPPAKSLLGGPMFTMRAKFPTTDTKEAAAIPGPGEYDYDHNYALGWSLGKFHRFGSSIRPKEKTKTYKPGPGAYEINRNILDTEGIAFPKSKRPKPNANVDADIEIGPGHYNLKPTVPQLQPYEHKKMILADQLHEMFV